MRKQITAAVAMVCAQFTFAQSASASTTHLYDASLRVNALIDGRDRLVVDSELFKWQHFDYAAVGRHRGNNRHTYLSLSLTHTETKETSFYEYFWVPEWPAPPPNEIRFRADSKALANPFPYFEKLVGNWTVSTRRARCAGVNVVRQPTVGDAGRLVADFNDNNCKSSFIFDVSLNGQVEVLEAAVPANVPLPAGLPILLTGLSALCLLRRRSH